MNAISLEEFKGRRAQVLRALDGAIAIALAGDGAPPLTGHWTPDWNFCYLTGIRDEPGAAVLFDPRSEDPKRQCVLLLKPRNPDTERWDGFRDDLDESLRKRTGFDTILRTTMLPRLLTTLARRRGRVACLHPFSVYDAPVSPDLLVFRRVSERVVGVKIEDQTNLLPSMRAIKSAGELAIMRRACAATERGYRVAARAIRPGLDERELQRALEDGFAAGGGEGTGYNSIVGAGLHSTVLHYNTNRGTLAAGDVVLIDAAASVDGYTADVTRTYPVSGSFSPEQKRVYSIVLEALHAAIAVVRPGVAMHEVEAAARDVIARAGYGDAFIHGIGHQLGIEVHDSTPDGPLREGMVITIEPGVYLPEQRLGVRIEDDILVTPSGHENLTASIPKGVEEVEAMVRGS